MRLAIFFPSKSAQSIPKKTFMDAKEWLEQQLSQFFGGLTTYQANGLWINAKGELEKENITLLETYTSKPFPATEVFKRLTFLREVLGQESLAFAIDDEIYFVTGCQDRRSCFGYECSEDGTKCSEIRIAVREEYGTTRKSWMKFKNFWRRKLNNREKKVK